MLNKNGVPTKDLVESRFPDKTKLLKPKAVIECYEDIPCNPCETSCPFHAITVGPDINQQPKLDVDACTGCGICVTSCPGLAIIVAQTNGDVATLKIPYEFLPRPIKGETWDAVDRGGTMVGDALIVAVQTAKTQDRTALVTLSIDPKLLQDVVTIRRRHG
jgi:Fe-S-cluster-containing hydrogenase component 2